MRTSNVKPSRSGEGASPTSGRRRSVILVVSGALLTLAVFGVTRRLFPGALQKASPSARSRAERNPELGALPYVNFVPVKEEHKGKSGTTIYKKDRTERGYNLYVPKPESSAILVDMQGELVHRWSNPEGQPKRLVPSDHMGWQTVRMTPKGELFAIVGRAALLKLDWNSNILWKAPIPVHHDVIVADDGDIYALTEERRYVDIGGRKRVIADQGVAVLSPDGQVKKRISFYDVFVKNERTTAMLEELARRRFRSMDAEGVLALAEKRAQADDELEGTDLPAARATLSAPGALERLKRMYETGEFDGDPYEGLLLMRALPFAPSDLFHANTILPLKKHASGIWKDGSIMVSLRRYDLLLVIDPDDHRIVWMWGPDEVGGQHQPTTIPNGNVLVFDNGRSGQGPRVGVNRRYSKILELDPVTKKEVWSYVADPPESFFSAAEGGCHLLANGNIVVADALSARAFEITRAKEIVWEYFNPKLDASGRRSGMYRIERLAADVVEPLLQRR